MKYPEMRKELLGYLQGLSNLEYQRSCWVSNNCPADVEHDELDYVIHFLFDDTTLSSEPDKWIGLCLRDSKESVMIKKVCDSINMIFEKYGYDLNDEEYIEFPEWRDVINIASLSLDYFNLDQAG